MKQCPYCEVDLTENRKDEDVGEDGEFVVIKCSLCSTASTWIGDRLRSYTTIDGDRTEVWSPVKEILEKH